jgi:hypothetical protein
MGNLDLQLWKLSIHVPPTREERALMALDVRQRTEAIVFQLEHPVGMIKGLSDADKGHRAKGKGHDSLQLNGTA